MPESSAAFPLALERAVLSQSGSRQKPGLGRPERDALAEYSIVGKLNMYLDITVSVNDGQWGEIQGAACEANVHYM